MTPNEPFPESPINPPIPPDMIPPAAENYAQQQSVPVPTATPPTAAPQPNVQTFVPSPAQNTNFIEQLTNIERKNQETLEIIAEGQRLILLEAKKRTSLERWRFWMGVLTKLAIIAVFVFSFFFIQTLIQGMMEGLGSLGGGLFPSIDSLLEGGSSVPVGPKPSGAGGADIQSLLKNPAIQSLLK